MDQRETEHVNPERLACRRGLRRKNDFGTEVLQNDLFGICQDEELFKHPTLRRLLMFMLWLFISSTTFLPRD